MVIAEAAPVAGPVLFGFTLGLVGAVNPCGFPLLPAYLVASASDADRLPLSRRAGRALGSGVCVTVGFGIVFGILGVISTGANLALGWVGWVMIPVGLAMVALGLLALAGRPPRLPVPTGSLHRGRYRSLALVGFGITYAVASLSCELPVFVAGVADSFTRQGTATGIPVSLAFALGMGLVITAVSVAGIGAQAVRLRRIRAWQPVIVRLAGAVVALVGAYLVLYWTVDLASLTQAPAPVRWVERLQSDIAGWLNASPRVAGTVIGLVVVATLAAASIAALRQHPSTADRKSS